MGDGKTHTVLVTSDRIIVEKGNKIEVEPKAFFKISDDGVVVYEDELIAKGNNRPIFWKDPITDAYLFVFAKKKIPESLHKKANQYIRNRVELKKLYLQSEEYRKIDDKTKMSIIESKIVKKEKELNELENDLDIAPKSKQ